VRIVCGCNQFWLCPKEVFQITGVMPSSSVDPRKILSSSEIGVRKDFSFMIHLVL